MVKKSSSELMGEIWEKIQPLLTEHGIKVSGIGMVADNTKDQPKKLDDLIAKIDRNNMLTSFIEKKIEKNNEISERQNQLLEEVIKLLKEQIK